MRRKLGSFEEVLGLWEPLEARIIIKREALSTLAKFSGTLLHEASHAISRANDVTREFELELTDIIGKIVENI